MMKFVPDDDPAIKIIPFLRFAIPCLTASATSNDDLPKAQRAMQSLCDLLYREVEVHYAFAHRKFVQMMHEAFDNPVDARRSQVVEAYAIISLTALGRTLLCEKRLITNIMKFLDDRVEGLRRVAALTLFHMKQFPQVHFWYNRFEDGRQCIEDDPRSLNLDNRAQHPAGWWFNLCADCRITIETIAEIVGISYDSCQSIVHQHLKMKPLCGYFVPRHLTVQQNRTD
ncbi:hypothetical protein LAZ67_6003911 [Cordylochernes scorpioides]|uniref:Uncharacterized protein n=1 Tax=Cordylochernes scorpioides TaxID=51811 RepID=A0ABY6KPM0_9ARAC|nr:hypothetical protein LAZ67_6003911 [Cordylochernes scorpioides]